mmetsp:Transcript_27569/g.79507  ORF Transcript_27569/g.79507 Transcript_27569/m.79507 type:complete len:304 (+) Transcript_27569:3-914(+)
MGGRGGIIRRRIVGLCRRFRVVRPPCLATTAGSSRTGRGSTGGLGSAAGVPPKFLPPPFEQILEGRRPLGVLPQIREGLLLSVTAWLVLIGLSCCGGSVMPVMMTLAPPGRGMGIGGCPRRRVAGGLHIDKGLRPKPFVSAPHGLLSRPQTLVRLVDPGEVVVRRPLLGAGAGAGQDRIGMPPPGHFAVRPLDGRDVVGRHGVETEEDERVGGVGEGCGGGGGSGGGVWVVGVTEGGGTAAGGTGGDGIGSIALAAILPAAENGGIGRRSRGLEALGKPEVGQEEGDGEGSLHRFRWWRCGWD